MIGVHCIPTRNAFERCPIHAVGAVTMPARTALLARVAGGNEADRNATFLSLVDREITQLCERPPVQASLLFFARLCSATNIREVFKHEGCAGVYRRNEPLAQNVVAITPKTSLSAAHLHEMPLGRFRSFGLQPPFQLKGLVFHHFPVVGAVEDAPRIGGGVRDAEVNTDHRISGGNRSSGAGDDHVQPPAITAVAQKMALAVFHALYRRWYGVRVKAMARRPESVRSDPVPAVRLTLYERAS